MNTLFVFVSPRKNIEGDFYYIVGGEVQKNINAERVLVKKILRR